MIYTRPSGADVTNYLYGATNPQWTLILSALLLVNSFFSGYSNLILASRITYAVARDEAIPYSKMFSAVDSNKSPVNATLLLFCVGAALQCLPLFCSGTVAISSVASTGTMTMQISYMIPIVAKLVFMEEAFPDTYVNLGRFCFYWKRVFLPLALLCSIYPLHSIINIPLNKNNLTILCLYYFVILGGFSRFFGIVACIWLLFTSLAILLPTTSPGLQKSLL